MLVLRYILCHFHYYFFLILLILKNYLTVLLYLFYIQYKCDCYTCILLIKHSNFFLDVLNLYRPKKPKRYYTVITPLLLANESFRKDVTTGLSTAFSFRNSFIRFVQSTKQSSIHITAVAKTGIWSSWLNSFIAVMNIFFFYSDEAKTRERVINERYYRQAMKKKSKIRLPIT